METGSRAEGMALNKRKITPPALRWRGRGERKAAQECCGRAG